MDMKRSSVLYLRLQRQFLLEKAKEMDYEYLFRQLSPVQTLFWIEPGSLPEIQYRCDFNPEMITDMFRHDRRILKGRFQGGNVGYVFSDEFPLYMAAYRKEIKTMTAEDVMVLDIIKEKGEASTGLIKSETGLLAKEVSKSLQKLQKAFIVLENQLSKDDERPFSLVEESLSHMNLTQYTKEAAMDEVIRRFIYMNGSVTKEMIKSFTKFTNKDIDGSIERLAVENILVNVDNEFILAEDVDKVEGIINEVQDQLYIMDNNDYMVKSHELILKDMFGKSKYKTLHYIMYNGEFIGRVLGFFRFGPNDLEDVEVLLDNEISLELKESIIDAIDLVYEGQENSVKRYRGVEINV